MENVAKIMSLNPCCCTAEMGLPSVSKLMVDHDCGEIPVVNNLEEKKPIGVITDRDICCRSLGMGKDPMSMHVKDCMTSPAITVIQNTTVDKCCDIMEERQVRRLIVVDDSGKCCGIVSQADVARKASANVVSDLLREISRPVVNLSH